ncbi:MAG: hypothetical protein R2757_07440 [Draconibacterium sp.]
MSDNPVIVEETFSVSTEKIQHTIIHESEMKNWYFDLKKFKPEHGS